MSDQLRDQFEAFRTFSAAQTQPPGLPAIRRTLARRYAVRATGFAVAAVVALVFAFIPGHPRTGVGPARPPVPSSSPTPSTSVSPSTTAGAPAGPSTPATPTHKSSPSSPATCSPYGPRSFTASNLLTSNAANQYGLSGALLKDCPNIRLSITRATYVGTGASSTKLTLYGSTTHTLTPASPSTTMPVARTPAGTCYTSLTVTLVGSGVPHTMTNIVPSLASMGSDDAAITYFKERGFDLIETSWSEPVC